MIQIRDDKWYEKRARQEVDLSLMLEECLILKWASTQN